jgi:hypothetical protein
MGERENFPNQPGTTMHNFLSNVNANNHLLNDYSLCVSFSILQQSQKFDFQCFVNDKNNLMKENFVFTFQKELSLYQ